MFSYDPWRRCVIIETEGIRSTNGPRRSITEGHPTGWAFHTIPDGWEANAHVVENIHEGWDDDIPTYNVNYDRTSVAGP